jgi:hypothetical protein
MIPQEEMTRTADRLTDALTAAAAIMMPAEAAGVMVPGEAPGGTGGTATERARAHRSPIPRPVGSGGSGRGRMGRLRGWLVPVGAAASVTAVIVTAVILAGQPGTGPAPGTVPASGPGPGPAPAPASVGPGITSLAGVPSEPGTGTPTPTFYVTVVSNGLSRNGNELLTVQVRRTSDGQLTATVPTLSAVPADWTLNWSVSATPDDRTFVIAAASNIVCPSSTPPQTRFYRFNVTSAGQVTGLRAVGQPVTGEAVSEFAVSPDGTRVAYAEQGCAGPASAASAPGVIHVMNLTSGAVRSWHSTVSAATPARVTTQIGALSWMANGRTLVADYQWKAVENPADLAVLGLDTTSSGGSLQAHSQLLFSQGDRCTVCVYTALTSSDGSALTAVAVSPVPASQSHGSRSPLLRESVLQLSLATGQPTGILYTSAPFAGSYEGLVPALYGDGQAQHWFLVLDPEQFGWVSGGKLVPLPIKASAGLMGIDW